MYIKCNFTNTHQKQHGATVLEMLVSVTIISILLSLVTPTTQHILTTNRIVADINSLSTITQRGQFSAVNEQMTVTLCPTQNYSTCTSSWSNAKMLFSDANENGQRDSNEALIATSDPLNSSNIISGISSPVIFSASGTINQNTIIVVCPSDKNRSYASGLILSFFGRIATAIDSNGDGFKEDTSGEALSCI